MTERVYISGPMRGYRDYNFPAFYRAEEVIREVYPDAEVFSPARRDADKYSEVRPWLKNTTPQEIGEWLFERVGEEFDIREAMAADLDYIVRHATVVVSLPGITRSSGYQAEAAAARSVGVPVVPVEQFLADAGYDSRIKPADEPLWNVRPYDNPTHEALVPDSVRETAQRTREMSSPLLEHLRRIEGHKGRVVEMPVPRCNTSGTVADMVVDVIGSDREILGLLDIDPDEPETRHDGTLVGEVRSVSRTGGEKGTKLARYDLIPTEPLRLLAEHFGRGARKYDDHNWRRGYEWSKSFSALCRHLWAFWGGEDMDAETGSPHMVAVAWHALVLLDYMANHPEFDDRFEAS